MHEFDPEGIPFQVEQDQQLKLVTEGEWKRWIVEKHPDGHWVSKWKATTADLERIATFCKRKWMSKDMGSSHAGGIWHEREKTVREMMDVPTREGVYDDSPYGPDDVRNDPPSGNAEGPAALKDRIDDLKKCLAGVYRCLDYIHVKADRMTVRQNALQGKAEIERAGVCPPTEPDDPGEGDPLRGGRKV